MRYYVIFMLTLGFTFTVVGAAFFGAIECVDGWQSQSIGSQGACSHHGGVAGRPFALFVASLVAALCAVGLFIRHEKKTRS